MAADVAQFLWKKFSDALQASETTEASSSRIHILLPKFQQIRKIAQLETTICSLSSIDDKVLAIQMQDLLYTLNDIFTDCTTFADRPHKELRKSSFSFQDWYFIRKKRKELDKLRLDLENFVKENSDSVSGGLYETARPRRTCPPINVSEMSGPDKQVREVQDLILNSGGDQFAAIGIVGKPGFGKTSLARAVFSSDKICKHFSPCIWVCLSEIPNDGVKIVQHILDELDYDIDHELEVSLDISKLLAILKGLLSGTRYLIVFDHVSVQNLFYEDLCYESPDGDRVGDRLSHGLPKGSNGAVMVITTSQDVADSMVGKRNLFRLYEPFLNYFNVSKTIGLHEEVRKIEDKLFKFNDDRNRFAAVGIVGMGGSGKTVLALKILESEAVCKEFSPMISVCLSDTYSGSTKVGLPGKILRLLLEELEYDLDELEPSNLENEKLLRILEGLLSGKKYLIVMDDVWQGDEFCEALPQGDGGIWDRLSHALPKGDGGAIIVTSRLEDVATSMVGGENLVRLEPSWNTDDCWKILTDIVSETRISRSKYNTFMKIREEIVELCDGLPLAATAIARLIAELNPAT